jgi:hypothetical protein
MAQSCPANGTLRSASGAGARAVHARPRSVRLSTRRSACVLRRTNVLLICTFERTMIGLRAETYTCIAEPHASPHLWRPFGVAQKSVRSTTVWERQVTCPLVFH